MHNMLIVDMLVCTVVSNVPAGAGLEMTRELLPSLRSLVASPPVAAEMQSCAGAGLQLPSYPHRHHVTALSSPIVPLQPSQVTLGRGYTG